MNNQHYVVAVGFYLRGGRVPSPTIALMELAIILRIRISEEKMKIHFVLVGGCLVVAHIAMIFKMVNSEILGSIPAMYQV